MENTFDRDFHVTKGANTYVLDLFNTTNTPSLEVGTGLTIESYDSANNVAAFSLDTVWDSFSGLRVAGPEGTVPKFEFDIYGRVRSIVNIPLSVSSNAVVDFVPSIYGVLEDAVRNNVENGIQVIADNPNQKINFHNLRYLFLERAGVIGFTIIFKDIQFFDNDACKLEQHGNRKYNEEP